MELGLGLGLMHMLTHYTQIVRVWVELPRYTSPQSAWRQMAGMPGKMSRAWWTHLIFATLGEHLLWCSAPMSISYLSDWWRHWWWVKPRRRVHWPIELYFQPTVLYPLFALQHIVSVIILIIINIIIIEIKIRNNNKVLKRRRILKTAIMMMIILLKARKVKMIMKVMGKHTKMKTFCNHNSSSILIMIMIKIITRRTIKKANVDHENLLFKWPIRKTPNR